MRCLLASDLNVTPESVDLIELCRANLAMRASVAEEGLPFTGQDSLAWPQFLQRTWSELEDFLLGQTALGLIFTKLKLPTPLITVKSLQSN
jgi:hypothetical protein